MRSRRTEIHVGTAALGCPSSEARPPYHGLNRIYRREKNRDRAIVTKPPRGSAATDALSVPPPFLTPVNAITWQALQIQDCVYKMFQSEHFKRWFCRAIVLPSDRSARTPQWLQLTLPASPSTPRATAQCDPLFREPPDDLPYCRRQSLPSPDPSPPSAPPCASSDRKQ